jgi:SOS regulatory protein LexA
MHAPDTPQALPPGNWWLQALPASIAAGFPSPAEDHQVERIDLMQQLVKHPQATFYIRVRGESMRDAGILDGDMALIQRNDVANTGDIVVALIDEEEATLKRFRRRGASIALEPANTAYEVRILPPNRVRIQGKLIGLYRKY